jgi:hypothetical protein
MQMPGSNSSNLLLRFSNIVAFALTILVNGLAGSTTLLGGKNTAMVSDTYFTPVTPAGYVFSIWGVIYILLGFFVVYQAIDRNQGKEFQKRIGWLFVLSSLANIVWIFLWQYEYLPFSVVLIFILLASLVAIYLRLGIGKKPSLGIKERIAIHLPFSVYLGWITVATVADVAAALVSIHWNGFGIGPETWSSAAILITLLITTLVIVKRKDVAYSLVIIWALTGIAESHLGNMTIVVITEASAIIVGVILVATLIIANIR